MLRRILWILFIAAACAPAQSGDAPIDTESATGPTDGNAALASTSMPAIVSVWPDHGKSGDVVTITGRGFGLDPRGVLVCIGGAPVDVASLGVTEDGYQEMAVELNAGTVSGPVSVYAGDRWTTFPGLFCAEPVIHGLTLVQADEDVDVQISGSNLDPFALVYVGDRPQETERLKTARRPHRIAATRLVVAVSPSEHGALWVENQCPDGRSYTATSTTTFWRSIRD